MAGRSKWAGLLGLLIASGALGQTHIQKAQALWEKGDLKAAEQEFRDAAWFDAKSADARCGLGALLALKNDLKGAIAEFREALRLDGSKSECKLWLADAFLASNALTEAVDTYRSLPDTFQPLRASNNLGVALYRKGDAKAALDSLRRASELAAALQKPTLVPPRCSPDAFVSLFNYGVALTRQGDYASAETALKRATASAAVREALVWLGHAQKGLHRWEGALSSYGRALQSRQVGCPAPPNAKERHYLLENEWIRLSEVHLAMASLLHERGEYSKAISKYQEALDTADDKGGIDVEATRQKLAAAKSAYELSRRPLLAATNTPIEPVIKSSSFVWYAVRVTSAQDIPHPHHCQRTYGDAALLEARSSKGPFYCVRPLSDPSYKDCPPGFDLQDNRRGEASCAQSVSPQEVCPEGKFYPQDSSCRSKICPDNQGDLAQMTDGALEGCIRCPGGSPDGKQTLQWLKKETGKGKRVPTKPSSGLCRVSLNELRGQQ